MQFLTVWLSLFGSTISDPMMSILCLLAVLDEFCRCKKDLSLNLYNPRFLWNFNRIWPYNKCASQIHVKSRIQRIFWCISYFQVRGAWQFCVQNPKFYFVTWSLHQEWQDLVCSIFFYFFFCFKILIMNLRDEA